MLEEGRQGPLVGSPLGPRGAGLRLLLFPKRVLGLKPPSGLSFGCWFLVQAFSRGDTWHLGLWVLPVLSAFYPPLILSFAFLLLLLLYLLQITLKETRLRACPSSHPACF